MLKWIIGGIVALPVLVFIGGGLAFLYLKLTHPGVGEESPYDDLEKKIRVKQ